MAKGKELIELIKQQRKEYNHWRAKERTANKHVRQHRTKLLGIVRRFSKGEKQLYLEKINQLLRGIDL